jgi:hypothetical protein
MSTVRLVPALLLFAACSAGTRSPTGAVRALAEAAQAGDRAEVWRLVGPETRGRLESDARKVAALSGRREVKPEQLLAVGWFSPRMQLVSMRELDREGDRATVEVVGSRGEHEPVRCVRVGGAWKVELP